MDEVGSGASETSCEGAEAEVSERARLTKGCRSTERVPRGPATKTLSGSLDDGEGCGGGRLGCRAVEGESEEEDGPALWRCKLAGEAKVRVTEAGMEMGRLPMCDVDGGLDENARVARGTEASLLPRCAVMFDESWHVSLEIWSSSACG